MSADNWATCPRCVAAVAKKADRLRQEAEAAYGKVSEAEYLFLKDRAAKGPGAVPANFREDYSIGVTDGGEFYVSYSGWCQACRWGLDYKHEQAVPITDGETP